MGHGRVSHRLPTGPHRLGHSHVIVADGYLGLLRVRVSDSTVVSLATHSEDPGEVPGKPLRRRLNFPNALDVDPATGDM